MKIYLIALAFFLPVEAHSGWFDKYSTLRDCQSFEQARKCQEGCNIISPSLRVAFEVNATNNTVIRKVFDPGETVPAGVDSLDGCSIVDEDNWICRKVESELVPGVVSKDHINHHQMVDGLYSHHYKYFNQFFGGITYKRPIFYSRPEKFSCARP